MSNATPIYRAIMLELERRRQSLSFPMAAFCEYAGIPERYFAKGLHADLPSGRQSQWPTLQRIAQALYPTGFDVEIKPHPTAPADYENLKYKLLQLNALTNRRSQRELMRALGRRASPETRRAARKKIPKRRRRAIGKLGAKARWKTPKVVEITGLLMLPAPDASTR